MMLHLVTLFAILQRYSHIFKSPALKSTCYVEMIVYYIDNTSVGTTAYIPKARSRHVHDVNGINSAIAL